MICKALQARATWQGKLVQSPREGLRHGYRSGFITDWDMAEDMISDRNLLIHTYDLAVARRVYAKLPGKVINPLREALEHLRVPYTIDLVDWHRCSEAFREVAGPQRVGVS